MADSDEEVNTKLVINQPYDECLDVPDAEEIASVYTPTPRTNQNQGRPVKAAAPGNSKMASGDGLDRSMDDLSDDDSTENTQGNTPIAASGLNVGRNPSGGNNANRGGARGIPGAGGDKREEDDDDDDEETTDEDDDDEDAPEGAYDPAEYEHLNVDSEIKEIFRYITKYTPQSLDLEFRLKPFIPDYIPAVGDIDAFLKVPRPDGLPDNLGLTVLDEPTAEQSDPSVLHHRLQAFSKLKKQRETIVKKIDNLNEPRGVKDLEGWLEQMSDLNTSLPSHTVHYTKQMPDIDQLMREWPEHFERALDSVSLPTADLNCDLETYIDLICATLDIPVHEKNGKPNRLQSLHVLFNLYLEVKNSSFFDAAGGGGQQ